MTYDNRGMICPHCGYVYEPDGTEALDYDQDGHIEECMECEKDFFVCANISVSWETSLAGKIYNERTFSGTSGELITQKSPTDES